MVAPSADAYRAALARLPPGETRSFLELAALAGRPGAARAAGRALAALRRADEGPWHRVVASDGTLARPAARAREQLRRLQREGARPRSSETIAAWAARRGATRVGYWPRRVHAAPDDARVARWRADRVEPFADAAEARARGFRSVDDPRPSVDAPWPRPQRPGPAPRAPLSRRLPSLDAAAGERLLGSGLLHLPRVLGAGECEAILDAAARSPGRFERSVDMTRHGFGVGAYHYFREPLPEPALVLRRLLYERLRSTAAHGWPEAAPFPPTLEGFWRQCRAQGQRRAACILLCYGPGGLNHPHRDLYGPRFFPFQALVMLSRRGRDFEGGDFFLVDEPAAERLHTVAADRGDVVIFASRERLVQQGDRVRRAPLRHGMDPVVRGERFALGLVLHRAR